MPHSLRDNNLDVVTFVRDEGIETVLDVGAGSGTYARVLHGVVSDIDAIEVWRPYVRRFGLADLYRNITIGDVRDLAYADHMVERQTPGAEWIREYDLIVFGDVLEHMTEDEAVAVWRWARNLARWGLISVPIIHWPQGAVLDNPFEAHVQDDLTTEEVRRLFGPFEHEWVYEMTATFAARFE